MRVAGAAAVPVLATMGVIGGGRSAPAGAQAAPPIHGDFDGDGLTDRATLGRAGDAR